MSKHQLNNPGLRDLFNVDVLHEDYVDSTRSRLWFRFLDKIWRKIKMAFSSKQKFLALPVSLECLYTKVSAYIELHTAHNLTICRMLEGIETHRLACLSLNSQFSYLPERELLVETALLIDLHLRILRDGLSQAHQQIHEDPLRLAISSRIYQPQHTQSRQYSKTETKQMIVSVINDWYTKTESLYLLSEFFLEAATMSTVPHEAVLDRCHQFQTLTVPTVPHHDCQYTSLDTVSMLQ